MAVVQMNAVSKISRYIFEFYLLYILWWEGLHPSRDFRENTWEENM